MMRLTYYPPHYYKFMRYIETLEDLKHHLLFVIPPKHLAELIKLEQDGIISHHNAKKVLAIMMDGWMPIRNKNIQILNAYVEKGLDAAQAMKDYLLECDRLEKEQNEQV